MSDYKARRLRPRTWVLVLPPATEPSWTARRIAFESRSPVASGLPATVGNLWIGLQGIARPATVASAEADWMPALCMARRNGLSRFRRCSVIPGIFLVRWGATPKSAQSRTPRRAHNVRLKKWVNIGQADSALAGGMQESRPAVAVVRSGHGGWLHSHGPEEIVRGAHPCLGRRNRQRHLRRRVTSR